jgi:uncharacterized protein YjbI with pentapeptide repeats
MSKKNLSVISNVEQLALFPEGVTIDFSKISSINFKAHNISKCVLRGEMTVKHKLNSANIIQSALVDLIAKTSFYNGDIKDSRAEGSEFNNCNFNESAHINNAFFECQFIACSFNQTSITYSDFEKTSFVDCDFTNTVISDSRFLNCEFVRCKTSNKLIESSLLFDCSYIGMHFNFEFITENFGVERTQLSDSHFRVKEGRATKNLLDSTQAIKKSRNSTTSPIEKFRWEFFESPSILSTGCPVVDKTFEPQSWISISRNANRFRLLIEKYHEFLLYQFEKDRAPFWNLLKLHNMTGKLSEIIDSQKSVDVSRALLGVHMSLTRLVEPYFETAALIADRCVTQKQIKLLVNGPLDADYYREELSPIFEGTTMHIEKVIKHNSPNELHIWVERIRDCLPFVALILAIKGKIGLSKIEKQLLPKSPKRLKKIKQSNIDEASVKDIIKTEFGFDNQAKTYAFKLQALLPGEHLFTAHIGLRTAMLGKIKKIILDFLPSSDLKVTK